MNPAATPVRPRPRLRRPRHEPDPTARGAPPGTPPDATIDTGAPVAVSRGRAGAPEAAVGVSGGPDAVAADVHRTATATVRAMLEVLAGRRRPAQLRDLAQPSVVRYLAAIRATGPCAGGPGAAIPGAGRSGSASPGTANPGASRSGTTSPGAGRSGAAGPGAGQPCTSAPGAIGPGMGDAGAGGPGTGGSCTGGPSATGTGAGTPGAPRRVHVSQPSDDAAEVVAVCRFGARYRALAIRLDRRGPSGWRASAVRLL